MLRSFKINIKDLKGSAASVFFYLNIVIQTSYGAKIALNAAPDMSEGNRGLGLFLTNRDEFVMFMAKIFED